MLINCIILIQIGAISWKTRLCKMIVRNYFTTAIKDRVATIRREWRGAVHSDEAAWGSPRCIQPHPASRPPPLQLQPTRGWSRFRLRGLLLLPLPCKCETDLLLRYTLLLYLCCWSTFYFIATSKFLNSKRIYLERDIKYLQIAFGNQLNWNFQNVARSC